jgi:thiazolinyl imide reductase
MPPRPHRAIVCGTKFGRIYLKAFRQPDMPFALTGILGQGSARSRRCAEEYGVPLHTSLDDLPDDIDAACVVVGSGPSGGAGAALAQGLMRRGIHVLQEHPLLPAELAECLRTARARRVQYHLNTHYVTIEPVRAFIQAAQRLRAQGRPAFIDAACSIQVAYTLFDILGEALGGLRPWAFVPPQPWPEAVRRLATHEPPYRSLEGVLAGIPFTLRVQNEMDPQDPDNYSHLLHRITLGAAGGVLTLVDTHGPVSWAPRLHLPASAAGLAAIDAAPAAELDLASIVARGGGATQRQVLAEVWPGGVAHALRRLAASMQAGEDPLRRGQYQMAVCELWQHVTRLMGFPHLRPGPAAVPLSAGMILDREAVPA